MTSTPNAPALVLGIDTGGTYTDGVLLEYHTRRVLASHKSLTTKRDFSIGIEQVIEQIQLDDPAAIRMVSISTTLATNAIAENKGKRVLLLLIGYDPELVSSFNMQGRFATPHFHYFAGGHTLHGNEQRALDLDAILETVNKLKQEVDAIAVSSYFSPLNPEHELQTLEAISRICDLPVVLGHQLSTKLGSIERATTAAINASLLAVLQDFVIAVRRAMARRQIKAPLMVVRGDGTLMSDEFASRTPVETIHSGPAASAIGGRFLSGKDHALVIDVGGTTTDLALIQDGRVRISEAGATVGNYKTAVNAADLLSIGLGGDSHIHLAREQQLLIGPERVVPLSFLAAQYPSVLQRLVSGARRAWRQTAPDSLEYWFLQREPGNILRLSARQQALIEALKEGPLPLPELVARVQALHVAQIGAEPLLRSEVIARAGLTPTDIMHTQGIFMPWNSEAAQAALETMSRLTGLQADDLSASIWARIHETIFGAILLFLSGNPIPPPSRTQVDLGRWLFERSLYADHPHLEAEIRLRYPIIGIGAPAEVFLKKVAEHLHTELILPPHYEVANAVGAVAGSVMVSEEALVYPNLSATGIDVVGYFIQSRAGRELVQDLEAALELARRGSQDRAFHAALRAGADNPQVVVEQQEEGIDSYRIQARAIGNPRLEGWPQQKRESG